MFCQWSDFSLGIFLLAFSVLGGCVPAQYLPTYPTDSDRIALEFVTALKIGMENESLQDVSRLIDERYGGYSNGRRTLISRMDEIFEQYEIRELNIEILNVTPYRGGLSVRSDWTIRWQCSSVNPDRGCSEGQLEQNQERSGSTTFELVRSDIRWTINEQSSDVLLGLFKPGDRISSET